MYANIPVTDTATTLLLYCRTVTYLFSSDEGSCYFFPIRSSFEFLAYDGVIGQSGHQLYFKMPVLGASLLFALNIITLTCIF